MMQEYEKWLKHALTPKDEPDIRLNQSILHRVKEAERLKQNNFKKIPAAVLAAVLVLGLGSMTVFAAMKYLQPNQVVEDMQDERLADAFAGENAVLVNETQSYGGYRVTFLGIISGEQLSEGLSISDGEVHTDRSHIVVAIENADGTPMPDTSEDAYAELTFLVSPFIKGYNPVDYNAYSLAGNYTDMVEDGVLYRLLECDNIEMFADCGLYLGVLDSVFYHAQAYHYDAATGEISRNEDYDGLNALFDLPIDVSKADPEAAAAYVKELWAEEAEDIATSITEENGKMPSTEAGKEEAVASTEPGGTREPSDEMWKWFEQLNAENLDEYAMRVEDTVQVLTPDEDGYMESGKYEIEGRGGSAGGRMLVSWALPELEVGVTEPVGFHASGTLDTLCIETYTLNADGTYTFAVYIPK